MQDIPTRPPRWMLSLADTAGKSRRRSRSTSRSRRPCMPVQTRWHQRSPHRFLHHTGYTCLGTGLRERWNTCHTRTGSRWSQPWCPSPSGRCRRNRDCTCCCLNCQTIRRRGRPHTSRWKSRPPRRSSSRWSRKCRPGWSACQPPSGTCRPGRAGRCWPN